MNNLFPENSYYQKCSCGTEFLAPKGSLHCHSCLYKKIAELENDLEIQRMRLAACGVVALANTEKTAKEQRVMHDDYKSASLSDVMSVVDSEMLLRKRITELEDERSDDYSEASTYATSLFNTYYKNKSDAVDFELCTSVAAIITQIDNMATGVIAELEKENKRLRASSNQKHLTESDIDKMRNEAFNN